MTTTRVITGLAYLAVCASLLCVGSHARAYSDPSMFAASTAEGGGSGRWFSGSPGDGYTCSVCHSGGVRSDLTIVGIPLDGYLPGASYEIIVDWPDSVEHVGVNVELTDESGASAGTISLPEGPTLDERESCVPYGAGILATTANSPNPARVVLNVADCGARRLRFLWTAPTEPRGQLWLSGAIVEADGSGDVSGDGVTDFARPITPRGGSPVASTVGGCTITRGTTSRTATLALGLCAFLAVVIARRRRGLRAPH